MTKNKKIFISFYVIVIAFFLVFLAFPLSKLLILALTTSHGFGFYNFSVVLKTANFSLAMEHSLLVAISAGVVSTLLAFIMSFTLNFTNSPKFLKKFLENMSNFPMFLPTIAYGFTIIYAFGNAGFISQAFGKPILNAFGFSGILLGFVIYTFPIAFILVNNTMKYIDTRLFLISKLMGDNAWKRLTMTLIRPMLTTLALSVIQSFFLSFTDFGLPSSLAGAYPMISTLLYTKMQGALSNFGQGTVVALLMLIPTVFTTIIMLVLQKYQVKSQVRSTFIAFGGKVTDIIFNTLSTLILFAMFIVFLPIFLVPSVVAYPYNMHFTWLHFQTAFGETDTMQTYFTSFELAVLTAIIGTTLYFLIAYMANRSVIAHRISASLHFLSNLTNAIPGMVLGIAFLLAFSSTNLNGTLTILLLVNLIHFFATPFQMANLALEKLSKHYETTGVLLGDNFFKTLFRIILPNVRHTIFEILSYIFIQSMVTISAIIFLVGANTGTLTTEMQSLQQFNKFSEVFVLALLLFMTNLIMKIILHFLANYKTERA